MSSCVNIIAIDGPAASGKSTLGLSLSRRLGFLFFDTGVMYRAITWLAIHHNLDLNDEKTVTELAERVEIDIRPASQDDGRTSDILAAQKSMQMFPWFRPTLVSGTHCPCSSAALACVATW